MKLLVASNNKNKLKEIREILGDGFEIVSLREAGIVSDPEETGKTFAENAYIKAKRGMDASGLPCLADDSGLCVEALGGAPGVYSARFAGEPCDNEKNNALLLKKLHGVSDRRASYVCSICLLFPDGRKICTEGVCTGQITEVPSGTGGFGYDPLFRSDDLNKTLAEATAEEKNRISHRGRALEKLERILKTI